MKVVLAINAGSSSVKVSVFAAEFRQEPRQLAEAQVSGLTAPPAHLSYTRGGAVVKRTEVVDRPVKCQDDAFRLLLQTLVEDAEFAEISDAADIAITCHRIVHGGDYTTSQLITSETYHHLETLSELAPLHNSAALEIVRSCIDRLPGAVNVACFDSQFHHTLPEHVRTYPINQAVARKNRLRKYGFHGISYAFIARSVAAFLDKDLADLNIIALHLGSGASACAIKDGQSWDTSMGLTPLAGLPGATRSGSVDPSLVFHYASDVGKLSPNSTSDLHISHAEEILNKQSGWKSLTGTTDFGSIAAAAAAEYGDPAKKLAFDLFVDRVCGFVGAYFVALGGQVDALVFAGGIGEHSHLLRRRVTEQVACLGFASLDEERNAATKVREVVKDIGMPARDQEAQTSRSVGMRAQRERRILVCRTDEQLQMARFCAENDQLW